MQITPQKGPADWFTGDVYIEIPKLGLGTWFIDNANAASAVKEAAKIGYRHKASTAPRSSTLSTPDELP